MSALLLEASDRISPQAREGAGRVDLITSGSVEGDRFRQRRGFAR